MWQNLVQSLEDRNTIHQGQVGGRAGYDANTLIFMEEMKNEISYCSRKLLVDFDNNVASCYDRIIPNLANLVGQKKGLHRNITFVHASTLEEARFKLKMALGVSEDFYQHCEVFLIYGTGQGSTNSPTIWLIISSTLFDIHKELSNGATFSDTIQEVEVHIILVGFVDNVTGQTNNFYNKNTTPEELICLMQEDAQL
eukprot:7136965-Ditylum_brightwellii.AAC.1